MRVYRLPLVGALFGAKAKQTKKTELIIFITPHIILGDATVEGTEPQKFVPSDIMPQHIREKYINDNMARIVANAKPKIAAPLKKGSYRKDTKKGPVVRIKDAQELPLATPPVEGLADGIKELKEF